jgi:hypothetical protein
LIVHSANALHPVGIDPFRFRQELLRIASFGNFVLVYESRLCLRLEIHTFKQFTARSEFLLLGLCD